MAEMEGCGVRHEAVISTNTNSVLSNRVLNMQPSWLKRQIDRISNADLTQLLCIPRIFATLNISRFQPYNLIYTECVGLE